MADLPPRYAYRVGRGEPDAWDERPDERAFSGAELATRRWMLVAAGIAAAVLIVALLSVTVFGRGGGTSFGGATTTVQDAAPPAAVTTSAAAPAAGAASAGSTSAGDGRQLACRISRRCRPPHRGSTSCTSAGRPSRAPPP
ncbi:MAG TPA: hypothetical protein PLX85_08855, partial [Dehalococcoidia bacterium]|nr:hypothetical protein [Dehalococcoidia bacterium]